MKRSLFFALAVLFVAYFSDARTPENVRYVYTDATDLNLIGKLFTDTPNPYHRIDTVRFKGFTKHENELIRCCAGEAVLFTTNSTSISIIPEYGYCNRPINATDISYAGFDLYVRNDKGEWIWAGSKVNTEKKAEQPMTIVVDMDGSSHDCMLYLPIYSELKSLKIGVDEGAVITPLESPFKGRIGIFGSSFTMGVSTSRAGMSYPMQFQRSTGYQILSIAASGRCMMQDYFADVICAAEFDAFIFDSFSNPDAKMIEERLEPFIRKIRQTHPGEPLIFQQTIYRENRNFDLGRDEKEAAKQQMADSLMNIMCKKYKNVYFIKPCACEKGSHEWTVDGVHPDNYGYALWERSIEGPVVKILRKHGIK